MTFLFLLIREDFFNLLLNGDRLDELSQPFYLIIKYFFTQFIITYF